MPNPEKDIDFKTLYAIPLIAMRLSRSAPELPQDKKWMLQFFLMHGIFSLQFIVMGYNIVLGIKNGDYTHACRNAIGALLFYVVTLLYLILVLKKDSIIKVMNMMDKDFKKNIPVDEKIIMFEYAKKGSNVCSLWLVLTSITCMAFPIKLIITELYLYIQGEFELLMMFPLNYPSPIEEIKMQPFPYIINILMMSFYEIYSCFLYNCYVPLGPLFMLHACGQLEIVKKRILNLYVNTSEEDTKAKFIQIVEHLQYIYKFVDYINDICGVVFEITMKASSFTIPITSYQVLETIRVSSEEFSIEFVMFIIAGAALSSLPCYYSDMLMEKSMDIGLAVYFSGWEGNCDIKTRKSLVLILQRTLRPCCGRTMFRTMSLDALTDVFRQAYAIFNLMNAALK